MKRILHFSTLSIILLVFMTACQKNDQRITSDNPDAALKASSKVALYHLTGNGSYVMIHVNENAVPAHLAHGDILAEINVTSEEMAEDPLDLLENPEKWYFYNDGPDDEGIDPSIGSFVAGPGTPPLGTGSVEISVIGQLRYNLATSQFGGTMLAEITSFAFSTYNPSAGNGGSANRSGYINFNVSFDGTTAFQGRLIYVPRDNSTVVQDEWQEWDALGDGTTLWRWSGFAANGNQWPDGNINDARTWNDLLSTFPDIQMHTLFPFLGLRVGEPYPDGYTENIDAVKFGVNGIDQEFDFED